MTDQPIPMSRQGMDPNLTVMPTEQLDQLRDLAEGHDEDVIAIFVLHGSEARGLALSAWTSLEGPGAEIAALGLVNYAMGDAEINYS